MSVSDAAMETNAIRTKTRGTTNDALGEIIVTVTFGGGIDKASGRERVVTPRSTAKADVMD
jgi:hypothetical protein